MSRSDIANCVHSLSTANALSPVSSVSSAQSVIFCGTLLDAQSESPLTRQKPSKKQKKRKEKPVCEGAPAQNKTI